MEGVDETLELLGNLDNQGEMQWKCYEVGRRSGTRAQTSCRALFASCSFRGGTGFYIRSFGFNLTTYVTALCRNFLMIPHNSSQRFNLLSVHGYPG